MGSFFRHTDEVQKKLGYTFANPDHLALAFVHRSYWNEHKHDVPSHNERLEFLGDAVLGLIAAEYLYTTFPDEPEGQISDWRANLVEASACVHYLRKWDLQDHLLLGKGEQMNVGKGRETILADLFEAVIGALYLDGGFESAKACFLQTFGDDLQGLLAQTPPNWKGEFQDYIQKTFQLTPTYRLLEERGTPHEKIFRVAVFVGEKKWGEGEGRSKREAQAQAAEEAMRKTR